MLWWEIAVRLSLTILFSDRAIVVSVIMAVVAIILWWPHWPSTAFDRAVLATGLV